MPSSLSCSAGTKRSVLQPESVCKAANVFSAVDKITHNYLVTGSHRVLALAAIVFAMCLLLEYLLFAPMSEQRVQGARNTQVEYRY